MTNTEYAAAHDSNCKWLHCPIYIARLDGWNASRNSVSKETIREALERILYIHNIDSKITPECYYSILEDLIIVVQNLDTDFKDEV